MKCRNCGKECKQGKRGPTRQTCSARCRKALSRKRRTYPQPVEMTMATRWTRADGKRPITITGAPASSTNETTWSTLEAVKQSSAGDGYGFMLGGGIGCYDLDNALDATGAIKPWANEAIDAIKESIIYAELSVSKRGLHLFVPMEPGKGTRRPVGDGSIETYSQSRFIRAGEPFRL